MDVATENGAGIPQVCGLGVIACLFGFLQVFGEFSLAFFPHFSLLCTDWSTRRHFRVLVLQYAVVFWGVIWVYQKLRGAFVILSTFLFRVTVFLSRKQP